MKATVEGSYSLEGLSDSKEPQTPRKYKFEMTIDDEKNEKGKEPRLRFMATEFPWQHSRDFLSKFFGSTVKTALLPYQSATGSDLVNAESAASTLFTISGAHNVIAAIKRAIDLDPKKPPFLNMQLKEHKEFRNKLIIYANKLLPGSIIESFRLVHEDGGGKAASHTFGHNRGSLRRLSHGGMPPDLNSAVKGDDPEKRPLRQGSGSRSFIERQTSPAIPKVSNVTEEKHDFLTASAKNKLKTAGAVISVLGAASSIYVITASSIGDSAFANSPNATSDFLTKDGNGIIIGCLALVLCTIAFAVIVKNLYQKTASVSPLPTADPGMVIERPGLTTHS